MGAASRAATTDEDQERASNPMCSEASNEWLESDLMHASERTPSVGSGTETRERNRLGGEWVEAEQKLAASREEEEEEIGGKENEQR